METPDFTTVTELAGDEVSRQQIERACHRYCWARQYGRNKDVLEVACGAGQGLGLLLEVSRSLKAGDCNETLLEIARSHYADRIDLKQFDAQSIPYPGRSFDVVLMFEAIYYVPCAEKFVSECRRILRPGGKLLLVTANMDLFDFNPSPLSHKYYGVVEMEELVSAHGFTVECYGYWHIGRASMFERALRPVKALAAKGGLIPKTMRGKKLLKRIVFGKLGTMPAELDAHMIKYVEPTPLPLGRPDTIHKVIYCAASLV